MSKIIVLRPRPSDDGLDALYERVESGSNEILYIAYTSPSIDDTAALSALVDAYDPLDVLVAAGDGTEMVLQLIEKLSRSGIMAGQVFFIASQLPSDVMMPLGTYAGITNILDANITDDVVGGIKGFEFDSFATENNNFVNIIEVLGSDEMGDSPKYDVKPGHLYRSPRADKIAGMILEMVADEDEIGGNA